MTNEKCPDVNTSIPLSSHGVETSGLLLRHASTWVRTVVSSSKVNLTLEVICFKCFLRDFTAASQRPSKLGAHSGMKFQVICYEVQKSEMICWVFCCERKSSNSLSSLAAPTKLVPWSLMMRDGFPLQAIKRLNEGISSEIRHSL